MPSSLKATTAVLTGVFLFTISALLLPGALAFADPAPVDSILAAKAVKLQLPAFHDDEMAGSDFEKLFKNMPVLPGADWPVDGVNGWSSLSSSNGDFNGSNLNHYWSIYS